MLDKIIFTISFFVIIFGFIVLAFRAMEIEGNYRYEWDGQEQRYFKMERNL